MQIRRKILLLLNVLMCVPLALIAIIIYGCTVNHFIREKKEEMISLVQTQGHSLENLMDGYISKTQLLANNKQLIEYMEKNQYISPIESETNRLKEHLSKVSGEDWFILNQDKKVVVASGKVSASIVIEDIINFKDIWKKHLSVSNIIRGNDGQNIINIAVPIYSSSDEIIGTLCRVLDKEVLSKVLLQTSFEDNEHLYIVDRDLETVEYSHGEKEEAKLEAEYLMSLLTSDKALSIDIDNHIYTNQNKHIYVACYDIEGNSWTLCMVQDRVQMRYTIYITGVMIIVGIALMILGINLLGRKFIKEMMSADKVELEKINSFCSYPTEDEFDVVSNSYNEMVIILEENHKNLEDVYEELTVMKKNVFFDGLTGCLSRVAFIERLDERLNNADSNSLVALLFIDLDDFKKVNDALTHTMGDKVLNYVGQRLIGLIDTDSFVGRFGGDEFVICKTQFKDIDEIHDLVYSVLSVFEEQLNINDVKVHLTCSVGVAIYPQDGVDSNMLMRNANTAMYKVKDNGKNSYSFYTKAMSQTLNRKLLIEEVMREGLGNQSFYLQFQPIVDSKIGSTVGCEALIRLRDHELGFISPGEFIPIAEESDLIIKIGDWVLENALLALKNIQSEDCPQFTMNINISSVQIRNKNFLEKLKAAINKTGINPETIKLEVTESVLIEDIQKSIELFKQIKDMGIHIALDDFGTGYSSLNYLRNIPLDVLKIDKSFVDEITTSKVLSEIVDSIINMAHALDLLVVAEGVEDQMQLEVLKKKGCDRIQGYYYSKPLELSELKGRLETEKAKKQG